jgi:hypothetical protein
MRGARNGIGLAALAVGMIACSDATQPTSTTPGLADGAKVSLTGITTMAIPTLDGRVISATTHEWAVNAVVTNGIAEAAQSPTSNASVMPVLYIRDDHALAHQGRANSRTLVSGKGPKGTEDFVFVNGNAGPAKAIVHVGPDGQVDQSYSFEWERVRGGWLATAFTATVFKNGKALARIRSSTKQAPPGVSAMRDAGDACFFDATILWCGGLPTIISMAAGSGYTGSGPCDCSAQLNDYLLAAAAFAAATQAAIDTKTIGEPWVLIGLAVFAAAASVMASRYNGCVQMCYRLQGNSGGSLTGPLFAFARDDPFRPARI